MRAPCPCGTQKMYMHCCRPFLSGKVLPDTAQALMRSRYTAFTKKKWHYLSETAAGNAAGDGSMRGIESTRWLGLVIHGVNQGGVDDDRGEVVFTAYYAGAGDKQRLSMHEHSVFKKLDGRWYYVDRVVSSDGVSGD